MSTALNSAFQAGKSVAKKGKIAATNLVRDPRLRVLLPGWHEEGSPSNFLTSNRAYKLGFDPKFMGCQYRLSKEGAIEWVCSPTLDTLTTCKVMSIDRDLFEGKQSNVLTFDVISTMCAEELDPGVSVSGSKLCKASGACVVYCRKHWCDACSEYWDDVVEKDYARLYEEADHGCPDGDADIEQGVVSEPSPSEGGRTPTLSPNDRHQDYSRGEGSGKATSRKSRALSPSPEQSLFLGQVPESLERELEE